MAVIKNSLKKRSPSSFMGGMSPGLATLHCVSLALFYLIFQNAMRMKEVRDELGFYWIYHSHPMNQLIHFFFVPTLAWTLTIWFVHLEIANVTISLPFLPTHRINHATIYYILGGFLYTRIDSVGGTLYLPVMYFFLYGSAVWLHERDQKQSNYSSWSGTGFLLLWSLLLHVISWAIQIYGHIHFEHGRPALMDSFAQSLTIAPLFAFYEGLWLLGVNTNLQQHTLDQAAALTNDLCTTGSPMHVCEIFASSA